MKRKEINAGTHTDISETGQSHEKRLLLQRGHSRASAVADLEHQEGSVSQRLWWLKKFKNLNKIMNKK